MPVKKRLGLSRISTSDSRASNCSLRLRVKRGQVSAPGMIGANAAIIWQPLQTPSANVSLREKKAANCSASRGSNMIERAGKILREDMEALGPVRLKDVDEAQMRMVNVAKDLANKGEIMISSKQEDEELIY